MYYEVQVGRSYLRSQSAVSRPGVRRDVRPVDRRSGGAARAVSEVAGSMSSESAGRLRRLVDSLDWAALRRPSMVTFTYPGEWRRWCRSSEHLEAHRRRIVTLWRRQYEYPAGVWVKEFQRSGRPHLHFVIGIPAGVRAKDVDELARRTTLRRDLEARYGKVEGRRQLPPIGPLSDGRGGGGDFALWLLSAWSGVVGTAAEATRSAALHKYRGVDVTVGSWSESAGAEANWSVVSDYLAKESAKVTYQKRPPDGFGAIRRWWGLMSGEGGWFVPEVRRFRVDEGTFRRLVSLQRSVLRERGISLRMWRVGQGATVFRLSADEALLMLQAAVDGGGRAVDLATGEVYGPR